MKFKKTKISDVATAGGASRAGGQRGEKKPTEKARRLARLVEGFLEVELTEERLQQDPGWIERLRDLLEKDLWEGAVSAYDPDWVRESLFNEDVPDLYTPQEIDEAWTKQGIGSVLSMHKLLKAVWDPFCNDVLGPKKESVTNEQPGPDEKSPAGFPQDQEAVSVGPFSREEVRKRGWEELDQFGVPANGYPDRFLLFKMPETLRVHCTLDGDTFRFCHAASDGIHALINLLDGLPLDSLKRCKECGKVFVSTSHHKRLFCCRRHAARYSKREEWRTNREGCLEYARYYYKENLSKAARENKRRLP